MLRLKQDQLLEICAVCTSYLLEIGLQNCEKGLFRFSPLVTDVKKLQQQLSQHKGPLKSRDDHNAHVVAGVLQLCLKELPESLLHEVYDDIVNTDVNTENIKLKSQICGYLGKLPAAKLQLFRSLCTLLQKVSEAGGNDSSIPHIAFLFGPLVCKPANSAYMSIRHSEALRTIRPVLQVVLEYLNDIFREVRSNPLPATKESIGANNNPSKAIPNNSHSPVTSFMSPSGSRSNVASNPNANKKPIINLSITVPPHNTSFDLDIPPIQQPANNGSSSSAPPPLRFLAWEWKALEMLTSQRAVAFLRGELTSDTDTQRLFQSGHYSATASPTGTRHKREETVQDGDCVSALGTTLDSALGGVTDNTDMSASLPLNHKYRATSARAVARRHMIAECKALRAQIFQYEEESVSKFGRVLKNHERGPAIAQVFVSYRDMKRAIRDHAALDIQRCVRGALSRGKGVPSKNDRHSTSLRGQLRVGRGNGNDGDGDRGLLNDYGSVPMDMEQRPLSVKSVSNTGDYSGGSGTVSGTDGSRMKSNDTIARYRDLLLLKKDLKRRLKKFDEDFLTKFGKPAKKSDKEVMRPLYQQYHEVKASLDAMKESVERLVAQGQGQGLQASDMDQEETDESAQSVETTSTTSRLHGESSLSYSHSGNAATFKAGIKTVDPVGISETRNSGGGGGGGERRQDMGDFSAMQEEKRALHAYLKKYERDFNQKHGRHVMRPEDIDPVAGEYQRYKFLKKMLKNGK